MWLWGGVKAKNRNGQKRNKKAEITLRVAVINSVCSSDREELEPHVDLSSAVHFQVIFFFQTLKVVQRLGIHAVT